MNACRTWSLASEGSLHREGPAMQYLHCDLQRALLGSCTKPTCFLCVSPRGKTPVLLVPRGAEMVPVFESAVICDYIGQTTDRAPIAYGQHKQLGHLPPCFCFAESSACMSGRDLLIRAASSPQDWAFPCAHKDRSLRACWLPGMGL